MLRGHRVHMSEITKILELVGHGHPKAADALLTLVYDELRRLASQRMSRESPGHTFQLTAPVHEAWLRLAGGKAAPEFQDRAHFFGAAAKAIRRILVESARRENRLKHGGDLERVDIDDVELAAPMPNDELLAMDEALDRGARLEPGRLCGKSQGHALRRGPERLGPTMGRAPSLMAPVQGGPSEVTGQRLQGLRTHQNPSGHGSDPVPRRFPETDRGN
jgi:RNA polymerase sigma factor (TIGR02999 family)